MRRGKLNKYRPVVDKFLSRGLTGRDLIALLYERLPEHDEAIARNIRYVSDVNIDDIFSVEEINFLCNNFSEIFSLYYGDDPSNPLFDGETSDLIECIGGMMGIKPGADILIPYHGINFAIHHPNCNHHFLQESDYAQILARNISQPGRSIGYTISQASEDKLEKQIEHLGQFDYIFAFPSTLLIHNSDIQRNIIDLLSLLKAGGTMGLFLSDNVCSDPNWIDLREFLTNHTSLSTSVINVRNTFISGSRRGCIFIIKRERSNFLTFADLAHKFTFQKVSQELRVEKILEAFNSQDPAFFSFIERSEIKSMYNLHPSNYPISEESRIKNLIKSFLRKDKFRDKYQLISSLYALSRHAKKERFIGHFSDDLWKDVSHDNINFLLERFEWVIELCFSVECLDYFEARNNAYFEIISRYFKKDGRSKARLLLSEGQIGFSLVCKEFNHIESWYRRPADYDLDCMISNVMHIHADMRFYNGEKYEPLNSEEKFFSHIVSIGDIFSDKENAEKKTDEILYLINNKLDCGGVMAILLPKEACYKEEWLPLRHYLSRFPDRIQSTVISFSTSESLFIIEKAPAWEDWSNYDRITLIDEIDASSIHLDILVDAKEKNDPETTVHIPVIALNSNCNFFASTYKYKDFIPEDTYTHRLGDVIKLIPREEEFKTDYHYRVERIIKRNDLYSDYLDCNIKFNDLERIDGRKHLYTSSNGGYFTYFLSRILIGKIEGQNNLASVAIEDSIIHFDVDKTITSLDYILKVLSTDPIIAKQAEYLTRGYGWGDSKERNEALLNIRINLPSIDEQNAILLADSRKGYEDKSEEVQRTFDEFRKNMHMQKHKVGQTISALATWVNYLELARQLGKKEDSDVVIPAYNTTVGDIYSNIQDSLKTLQTEIAALDSSYGLEKDAKTFALADFLDSFCNKSCPGYELIWNSQSHRYQQDLKHIEIDDRDPDNIKATVYEDEYIIRAGDPMDYIHFPEKALETILENIIANAVAHGFTDPQKHYQIKFDIERDGTSVVLFVSNNGQPLHKDMVPAEVFTYGHTSGDEKHSGIGGYQILEYMRAFGGSAEIISTPDDEYSVTYKLTFKDANPSIKTF